MAKISKIDKEVESLVRKKAKIWSEGGDENKWTVSQDKGKFSQKINHLKGGKNEKTPLF